MLIALLGLGWVKTVRAAEIVINEVFANPSGPATEETEFIELYNLSGSAVDISNYSLADNYSSYVIQEATMSAQGFMAFRKNITGLRLSNSGDEVSLKNSNGQQIDYFSYDSSVEDKSWARIPDGTGQFMAEVEPTEAAVNQAPTPSPSPSPSPSESPSPEPSSEAVVSPSLTSWLSPTPLTEISQELTIAETEDEKPKLNLWLGTASSQVLGTEASITAKTNNPYQVSVWLTVAGLGLIGLTTWLWFKV